jgi:hypothetical protein
MILVVVQNTPLPLSRDIRSVKRKGAVDYSTAPSFFYRTGFSTGLRFTA